MSRDPQHVLEFFKSELSCDGTLGQDDMLILEGKFQQKQLLEILKKYIVAYVQCEQCQAYNTTIEKDMKIRRDFLNCTNCGATRTVQQIESTYKHVGRG